MPADDRGRDGRVGYPVEHLIQLRDQVNALGARLDAATAERSGG
ncbi:hypothetical protein [Nocardia sp. NPDC049707]